jgi:hypothetical protein
MELSELMTQRHSRDFRTLTTWIQLGINNQVKQEGERKASFKPESHALSIISTP